MADRFLIDGEWYGLGADGEYYRLYPIKGTPATGDTVEVNADGVPEFTAAEVVEGVTYSVAFTIPSGTVASDLTNYPVMVRLSDMPAGFWTHVKADGGDIRVKTTGGALVPIDLVRFDYDTEYGILFFLAASVLAASDNEWAIHYGDAALDLLPPGDTNGRNAVWADYEAVFTFGESGGDDRTGGDTAHIYGDPSTFEVSSTSSADLNSHQGVCSDGTHYYTTDTNAIYKWDQAWSLVASNADPIGDAAISGSPTVNHCGDVEEHDGLLYIPMECYPASGGLYNAHIGVFNASDLSFVQAFDISAQAHEAASAAYCTKDDLLYVVDYDGNDSTIYKYDPTDGSYIGTLTTDRAIADRQGITWWRESFWVADDSTDETVRVSYTGVTGAGISTASGGVFGVPGSGAGDYEGIGHTTEGLLQLIDPGTTERVDTWTPLDIPLGAGGGVELPGGSASTSLRATGRSSLTTLTLAISGLLESKNTTKNAVTYWDESSGATDHRVSMGYHQGTGTLGVWDHINGWLDASPAIDPTLSAPYRMVATYNGSTGRELFVNGAKVGTDAGITILPSDLDTVLVGLDDDSNTNMWDGHLGFCYLRNGVLSDAFIAAEYDNLNTPASFYEVAAEVADTPADSLALDDLSDVDTTGVSDGEVLTYDSGTSSWVPGAAGGSLALDDLTDVDATTPSDGDVLTFDSGTSEWVPAAPTGGSGALDDLTDVAAPTPSDGDVLTFDSGSGDWVNAAPSSGLGAVLYDSGPLGSPANAIDTGAAGIAGGYDVLEVWFIGRTNAASGTVNITFNNDTGSNYARQFVRGASTTASATGDGPTGAALFGAVASTTQPANDPGIVKLSIPFYTDTTFYKVGEMVTGQADSGNLTNRSMTWSGFVWENTAAITRMAVAANGGVNFVAGSRLIIYGR